MAFEWFRVYHGIAENPKLHLIAAKTGTKRYEVLPVWICVLNYASQAEPRGSLAGIDPELIAFQLWVSPEQEGDAALLEAATERVKTILQGMRDKGLITGDIVTNWAKRQYEGADETATQRKRNQRARGCHARSHPVTAVTP